MSGETAAHLPQKNRIASIDELRGYAIFGMLLVNYFGHFDETWNQLHHHRTGFTYADSIAPLFMFVVGMGLRLSILRRKEQVGLGEARKGLYKRYAVLACIGFTIYQGWVWDALTNIALAGLLAIVVADKKPSIRIAWGLLFVGLYEAFVHFTSYGPWIMRQNPWEDGYPLLVRLIPLHDELFGVALNGGIIGHWSWMLMMIFGTIGYDLLMTRDSKRILVYGIGIGVALVAIGWMLKVEWPGLKAEWPFSKYYMTSPFAFAASGASILTMVLFYVICDIFNLRIPHMAVLGLNPLIIYIIQSLALESILQFIPDELESMPLILAGFLAVYLPLYLLALYLYKNGKIIKL